MIVKVTNIFNFFKKYSINVQCLFHFLQSPPCILYIYATAVSICETLLEHLFKYGFELLSLLYDFTFISFTVEKRCPLSTFLGLGNKKKSQSHIRRIGWLWHYSDITFRQELLDKQSSIRRCVVVVKNPRVISPKFGSFFPDCLAQIA